MKGVSREGNYMAEEKRLLNYEEAGEYLVSS